jgi:hypothetical protein
VAPAVVGSNPTAHPKILEGSFASLRISAADSRLPRPKNNALTLQ